MNRLHFRLMGFAALVLGMQCLPAAVRTVTNLDDSGAGSLRNTIAASVSGDTINFSVTGTILLTTGQLVISNKNVTITGPGPGSLRIERSASAAIRFRIFRIYEGAVLNLSGLAIAKGSLTNFFDIGAGLLNGGSVTMNSCVVESNFCVRSGGGIYTGGSMSIVNCTIANNISQQVGGGVVNFEAFTADNCTFALNESEGGGGAIYNEGGTIILRNSTLFENNRSSFTSIFGYAIYSSHSQFGDPAEVRITSCTIVDNGASNLNGRTIDNSVGSALTIRNTILRRIGTSNASIVNSGGTVVSEGYNLCNDGANGLLTGPNDQLNTDPMLSTYDLQDNGGLTKTIALLPGSPAIDKGRAFGLTTDQRGFPRPVDNPEVFPAPQGDGSDIGAYESSADPVQGAVTLVVNSLDDHDDGIAGERDCTLREAISRANALPGHNRVIFAGGVVGTIFLRLGLGALAVTDSITIEGPGARTLTVSANIQSQVFAFLNGGSILSHLTIRDGWAAAPSGSGLYALAGGIYNQAFLTIENCSISENRVIAGSASISGSRGGDASGGGVFNVGTLTLNRCVFIHNGSFGGAGALSTEFLGTGGTGGNGRGGAIYNENTGILQINLCTFYNNVANGGLGGDGNFSGRGGDGEGAVFNVGTMTVTACTLKENYGLGGPGGLNSRGFRGPAGVGRAGGIAAVGGSSVVGNTICASNIASGLTVSYDVDGAFTSEGFNLIGSTNNSTGFVHPTDQVGKADSRLDPRLGPLQNNGGPTDTMALLLNSPAVDRGHSFGWGTDQRGSTRRVDSAFPNAVGGDGTDIGAFEINLLGGSDSDGDGMSDEFETFFGVTDGSANPDGDPLTNLQEFQAGTNPLDGASGLRIITAAMAGNAFTVTFAIAVAGRSYRMERKNAVSDVSWTSIDGVADVTPATTGSAQITDPAAGATRFYRIRLLP